MITKIGELMLYVNDLDQSANFWTEKIGFTQLAEHNEGGMRWINIAPTSTTETQFVLHDKKQIAAMHPEVPLATPALLFYTKDIQKLHEDLFNKGLPVGDIVEMGGSLTFNFPDPDGNYFAVKNS